MRGVQEEEKVRRRHPAPYPAPRFGFQVEDDHHQRDARDDDVRGVLLRLHLRLVPSLQLQPE